MAGVWTWYGGGAGLGAVDLVWGNTTSVSDAMYIPTPTGPAEYWALWRRYIVIIERHERGCGCG